LKRTLLLLVVATVVGTIGCGGSGGGETAAFQTLFDGDVISSSAGTITGVYPGSYDFVASRGNASPDCVFDLTGPRPTSGRVSGRRRLARGSPTPPRTGNPRTA
jgi:hypothetical protein